MTAIAGALSAMPVDWAKRESVRRVVSDLIAEQRSSATRRTIPAAEILGWCDDTRLDEDGIGFDSLALLEAASRTSEFFHLHEVGIEDYLLIRRTLGSWTDIVVQSLRLKSERLTFRTSGSTGEPKLCTHAIAVLREEARLHAGELMRRGRRRIVSLVPAHHIYGFLFTVLLPAESRLPLLDARSGILALRRRLQAGDVVIGTPFFWSLVARQSQTFPDDVLGVTSTAPMPAELRRKLTDLGLADCLEIYGSSETAGIGMRWSADDAFSLFPYWQKDGDGLRRRAGIDPISGLRFAPTDELAWVGPRHVRPMHRKDGAVQVAGVNVHPIRIATILAEHPSVADCNVGLDGREETSRLVATIVPRDTHLAIDELEQFACERLSPPERPAFYRIVSELPRSAMGKTTS